MDPNNTSKRPTGVDDSDNVDTKRRKRQTLGMLISTPPPLPIVVVPPPPQTQEVDQSIEDWLQTLHSVGSQPQHRETARLLVPLLSHARATGSHGWIAWANVGWVLSHLFGADDEGRALFHEFSRTGPNYSSEAVDHVYDNNNGRVTLGSLVGWAREDSPDATRDVVYQAVQAAAPVIGGTIDTDVIHEMVRVFNSAWTAVLRDLKRKNYPPEYTVARAALDKAIVLYMNNWICLIRGTSGPPSVIEEVVKDGVTRFVLRKSAHAHTAYKRHTLGVVGDQKVVTPMTVWLSNRHSKQYDTIVFNPNPASANPRSLNLYRGPAITQEASVRNDGAVKLVTDHIHTILASGNVGISEYLLNWMAHLIQRPWIKMITVPVFKGGHGADTGMIVQKLGDILGTAHFMADTTLESVTGQFHEERVKTNLLAFLDEGVFAGETQQRYVLKELLSEKWRKWECKYHHPIRLQNFSNFIVASNNYDRIVRVKSVDRRWIRIEVDSRWSTGGQTPQSKAYFDALANVDTLHFAYFLYNRDIRDFDPSAIPSTEYGKDPKKQCLESCFC